MKKITSFIICVLMVLTLISCGGGKPEDMSDGMYQIGLNALSVADQYISGKISGDNAYHRLEEFYEQTEAQKEYCEEIGTEYRRDVLVSSNILRLQINVYWGSMAEVLDCRDSLAETLGK